MFRRNLTKGPQSICLVGLRDVRDYRIKSDNQQDNPSPFNIKAESLVLPDFSFEQVRELYEQHTQETGQKFTDEAIIYAFDLTQGQPWLTNALAYQACFVDVTDRSISITKSFDRALAGRTQDDNEKIFKKLTIITKDVIIKAKEALIRLALSDNFDCKNNVTIILKNKFNDFIDVINEKRIKYILEAMLTNQLNSLYIDRGDLIYIRDQGIIKRDKFEISNPIYSEIIFQVLTQNKKLNNIPFHGECVP